MTKMVCSVVGFSETFKRTAIYFIIHYDGTVNGSEYHPGSLMGSVFGIVRLYFMYAQCQIAPATT